MQLRKSQNKFMRFGPIANENIQVSSWGSKASEDETKKRFHIFFFLSFCNTKTVFSRCLDATRKHLPKDLQRSPTQ